MIVVDASAFVELITDENGLSERVRSALFHDGEWACPEHATIETASALRGLWLGGRSIRAEFEQRISILTQFEPAVYSTAPLLTRVMQLASNASPYDAAYVALAEALQAPLITTDAKLARVPHTRAEIVVISD